MGFPGGLFPVSWEIAGWLALVAGVVWAVRRGFWRPLASDPARGNVWAGAIVAAALLWSLRAGIQPGLGLHMLGAMAFVLAFGAPLALAGLCVVLATVTLSTGGDWASFGLNALATVFVPVAIAQTLFAWVERRLPNHFFVYVFVNAFFGAGIALFCAALAGSALLWAAGVYPAEHLLSEYLPYCLLLASSEGWISGMVVTLMVVYRPGWVSTFDDARYLLNK